MNRIICKACGGSTTPPPEGAPADWESMCPHCVIVLELMRSIVGQFQKMGMSYDEAFEAGRRLVEAMPQLQPDTEIVKVDTEKRSVEMVVRQCLN